MNVNTRVKLKGTELTGEIVRLHQSVYGIPQKKKFNGFLVQWDNGKTGICEKEDLIEITKLI